MMKFGAWSPRIRSWPLHLRYGARLLLRCLPQTQEQSPLRKVVDIPLPGKAVRFDYKSLDATHGRLYIAHMNADQLVVFDIKKHEVVTNLDGFLRVHGVWAVPEIGRVYASATGEHQVAVVDMQSLKTIAKAGPVQYPDGLAYAAGPKRVFVSDKHGNADAVVDATTNALLTMIPLAGGAGNTLENIDSRPLLRIIEPTTTN